ncbi:hypothetical protein EJV47_17620 [Hymenobacter gummosus]|uniref:Uncharacterized protein n=1 Tax=Hymenobacter gummosus TaxID=1776032 RepID=A0A431TYW2_9BACT|nr:hypothetical protein [Hymenobacter gummosus]RTQ47739.1 hypothetical protein EJV47_17620 [Hymenobacter gummosus]
MPILCLLSLPAAAQNTPAAPAQPQPTAPARGNGPSVYRNQNPAPAVAPAEPLRLSAQDRQAYENCPNPRRYGPKARSKKMVRIW